MIVDAVLVVGFILAIATAVLHAGAEISIGPVSRDSVERLIESRVRGARIVYSMMENKRRFHLMLLSGRIMAYVAGTVILHELVVLNTGFEGSAEIAVTLMVFAVSTVVFIVAEGLLARLFAVSEFEDTVARLAWFLLGFHIMLYPVTWILDRLLSLFIKKSHELAAKEEALIEFVKSETEEGIIEIEEREMIEGVMDFFDTTVREVMVPRIDMIAVDKTIDVGDLVDIFRKEGHSRIPVYDERIDNIIGVIYAKDILPVIGSKTRDEIDVTRLMRRPFYVPEAKKISILMKEFKKAKIHVAIVVDEYGGTAGLVALEDLLEEIVGDIQDEYDRDERDYLWINDRTVLMDAGLVIDDVNDIIHSDIPDEDFDTLGGFIYHQLGAIPTGGEEFTWEQYRFIIKEIDGNRISKVLIKRDTPIRNGKQTSKENEGVPDVPDSMGDRSSGS